MGGDKAAAAFHPHCDLDEVGRQIGTAFRAGGTIKDFDLAHDKLVGATPIDTTPPPIDRVKLLAWLRSKKGHRNPLTGSIYEGMTTRIERGDFDQKGTR